MTQKEEVTRLLRQTLNSIHPGWKPLFKANIGVLRDALTAVTEDTPLNLITPPLNMIFRAFIINPKDIRVIIIDQDPYQGVGQADGLAFSTNSTTTPARLKHIFKCLNRLGYSTTSNNLTPWLLNGVLLLNMALTTEVSHTKKHSVYWLPFITQIISALTLLNKAKRMSILLWGREAQKLETQIKGKNHHILKWTYPLSITDCQLIDDKKFLNCDNFDNLKDIDWSTDREIEIYTDGSGRADEDCASAVYIPGLLKLSFLVKPCMYEMCEAINAVSATQKTPTTQRAEYLGVIYALWLAYKLNLPKAVIVTDCYNAYGIIVEWRKRKEEKYENVDLVRIMRHLYELVNERVTLQRVLSHGKSDSQYNEGNNIVDKLAFNHFKKFNGSKNYDLKVEYDELEVIIH